MCVHMLWALCVWSCTSTRMWVPVEANGDTGDLSGALCLLYWSRVFYLSQELTTVASLVIARLLVRSPFSTFKPWFYLTFIHVSSEDLNSGPHTCRANWHLPSPFLHSLHGTRITFTGRSRFLKEAWPFRYRVRKPCFINKLLLEWCNKHHWIISLLSTLESESLGRDGGGGGCLWLRRALLESKASQPQKKSEIASKEDFKPLLWKIELTRAQLQPEVTFRRELAQTKSPDHLITDTRNGGRGGLAVMLPTGHSWAVRMRKGLWG